jgi:hypothetical protein
MSKFSYQCDTGPGIYHGLEELCVGFLDQAALQIRTFDEELLQENSAKLNQCRRGPAGKQRMFRGFYFCLTKSAQPVFPRCWPVLVIHISQNLYG